MIHGSFIYTNITRHKETLPNLRTWSSLSFCVSSPVTVFWSVHLVTWVGVGLTNNSGSIYVRLPRVSGHRWSLGWDTIVVMVVFTYVSLTVRGGWESWHDGNGDVVYGRVSGRGVMDNRTVTILTRELIWWQLWWRRYSFVPTQGDGDGMFLWTDHGG